MSPGPIIGLYLVAMNLATFVAFADDKGRAARGERRIPERSLLSFAAAGGGLGALLGQQLLRHKTRKEPFRSYLRVVLVIEAAVALALLSPRARELAAGVLLRAFGL